MANELPDENRDPEAAPAKALQARRPVEPVAAIPAIILDYHNPGGADNLVWTPHAIALILQAQPWAHFASVALLLLGGSLLLFACLGWLQRRRHITGEDEMAIVILSLSGVALVTMAAFLSRFVRSIARLKSAPSLGQLDSVIDAQRIFLKVASLVASVLLLLVVMVAAVAFLGFAF